VLTESRSSPSPIDARIPKITMTATIRARGMIAVEVGIESQCDQSSCAGELTALGPGRLFF